MKKYRTEWKYRIKMADYVIISERLSRIMERDRYAGANGKYTIHSMYFDDYFNKCARDNVAGEAKRFKYRIRYYNDMPSRVSLEKKEKYNSFCHKRIQLISKEAVSKLICGDLSDDVNEKKDLEKDMYIDIMSKGFHPTSIVDYVREAYVEPISNVRITLDTQITASNEFERYLEGDYIHIPILEEDEAILEVKFDEVLPAYIRKCLQSVNVNQQSYSKYYMSRLKLQDFYKVY